MGHVFHQNRVTLLPAYGWLTICFTILFNIIYIVVVLWPNYRNIKYLLLNIGWNTYMAYSLLFNFYNIIDLIQWNLHSIQFLYFVVVGLFLLLNYLSLIQHAVRFYNFYTIDFILTRIEKLRKLKLLISDT